MALAEMSRMFSLRSRPNCGASQYVIVSSAITYQQWRDGNSRVMIYSIARTAPNQPQATSSSTFFTAPMTRLPAYITLPRHRNPTSPSNSNHPPPPLRPHIFHQQNADP
ncbi:hypothetical protein PTI98_011989 [Pleurotus ostreatus]|nr:hypothetical protein PTI98_011989 [Pleurotus ostreatus]